MSATPAPTERRAAPDLEGACTRYGQRDRSKAGTSRDLRMTPPTRPPGEGSEGFMETLRGSVSPEDGRRPGRARPGVNPGGRFER